MVQCPDAVAAVNIESMNRLNGHSRWYRWSVDQDGPNQHVPTLRNKKKEPLGLLGLHTKKKEPLGFLGFHIFMINAAFQERESIDVQSSLQVYSTLYPAQSKNREQQPHAQPRRRHAQVTAGVQTSQPR